MGTGGGLVVIDFSEQGNSAAFRVDGWSGQEPDRVWGIGPRSVLRVPIQPSHRPTVLEAEIAPLQVPPLITGQIVRIRVNGRLIGGVRLELRSMIRCEIDPDLLCPRGLQEIVFEFPGFFRPDRVSDTTDDRPLSGWFSFVRLYTTDMFQPGPWFPVSLPDIPVIELSPPAAESSGTEPGPSEVYTFGPNGSASPFLRAGWDGGEEDFNWTVAASSHLRLPVPGAPGPYVLRVDARPLIVPGTVRGQRVTVVLGGIAVGQLVLREAGCWILPLPNELIWRDILDLSLVLPDACHYTDFGHSSETHLLGIAVTQISIVPLPSHSALLENIRAEQAGKSPSTAVSDRFLTESKSSLPAAIEAATGMNIEALTRRFESLGTNREFAMIQSRLGVDPLNLLRFCECTLLDLVRALADDLNALTDPESITVSTSDGDARDYVLAVTKYSLRWRTPFGKHECGGDATPAEHAVTLGYLRRKFHEGLRTGHKIHVLKRRRPIPIEQAAVLLIELERHGRATLLCVEPASGNRLPGEVELLAPGLMRGYVDRSDQRTDVDFANPAGWLLLLANAALLHGGWKLS